MANEFTRREKKENKEVKNRENNNKRDWQTALTYLQLQQM